MIWSLPPFPLHSTLLPLPPSPHSPSLPPSPLSLPLSHPASQEEGRLERREGDVDPPQSAGRLFLAVHRHGGVPH